tara:strand:- start:392 stop:979 length:588 start_codon:yes stop_codon:yes gene_type:complete
MDPTVVKLLLIISFVIAIANIKDNIGDFSIIGVNLLYIMLILQHSLFIKYNVKKIKNNSYIAYYNKSIPIILLIFMLLTQPWLNMSLIYKLNILLIIFLYYSDITGLYSKLTKKLNLNNGIKIDKWKNKLIGFIYIVNLLKIFFIFLPKNVFFEQLSILAINTLLSTGLYYNNPTNYYENWNKLLSFAPIYSKFL